MQTMPGKISCVLSYSIGPCVKLQQHLSELLASEESTISEAANATKDAASVSYQSNQRQVNIVAAEPNCIVILYYVKTDLKYYLKVFSSEYGKPIID